MSIATAIVIYLPIALYPYLRADDTFLVRSNHFLQVYEALHEVNGRFVHIVFAKLLDQGQPLFWLSINGTAYLWGRFGLGSLMIVRGVGIVVLALFSYQLSRCFLRWKFSPVASACLSALTIALPGFQILMGNGVWLILPLWWAALAGTAMRRAFDEGDRRKRLIALARIYALILAGFFFYQSMPFFFAALAAIPMASTEWRDRPAYVKRYVMTTLAIMVSSTVIYYGLWRLLDWLVVTGIYTHEGSGYAPTAIFHELGDSLWYYADLRIPQVLNLWVAPYLSRTLAKAVAGFIVAVWLAELAVNRPRRRETVVKLALYAALFVSAESILLVTDHYNQFSARYINSICPSFIFVLFMTDTLNCVREFLRRLVRRDHQAYTWAALAVTLVCCVKAEKQTLSLIVLPSSLETRFVATRVLDYLKTHGRVVEIELIGSDTPLLSETRFEDKNHPEKFSEYTYRMFDSLGYLQFLGRNMVLELSGNEPDRVITRVGDTEADFIYPGRVLAPDSAEHRLVVDTRTLTLDWHPR